jgi:hypothetical protein
MNTTSTAQYAALAANNSCRRAFVNMLIAAEKSSVNTTRTPMASKVPVCPVPKLVSLYIATTGRTRSTKMMLVMIRPTKASTRDAL